MIHEDDVAGLFAAQIVRIGAHLTHHCRIADVGPHQSGAATGQGQVKAKVTHYGGDYRIVFEQAASHHLAAEQRHDIVAVEPFAALIDEQVTIAVAVERDTDIGPMFDYRGLHL